ncbi:MAG: hypothetical protein JSU77_11150 [Fidelibacterota bacterium]|nr:MAG: hypothetical protein JSU77_11150 [Candidatus Neomarinimicrobiota bacterium]
MALRHLILAAVLWAGIPAAPLWSWGFEVHRLINGQAVDLTPGPLGTFLQQRRNWIVALSTDPDQRREYDKAEEPNHYIDLEYFSEPPYTSIPHDRREADEKYGTENLAQWGILPWHIVAVATALKEALAAGEWERTVVLAADLGHYVADAHQPLHTTANYDGEQTGNEGIHHMFENIMLEQHLGDYQSPDEISAATGCISAMVFGWLLESFHEVPGILKADRLARRRLTEADKEVVAQGFSVDPDAVSPAYINELYARTGPMAWRRISRATTRLTALWLRAWEEAGKPTPPQ